MAIISDFIVVCIHLMRNFPKILIFFHFSLNNKVPFMKGTKSLFKLLYQCLNNRKVEKVQRFFNDFSAWEQNQARSWVEVRFAMGSREETFQVEAGQGLEVWWPSYCGAGRMGGAGLSHALALPSSFFFPSFFLLTWGIGVEFLFRPRIRKTVVTNSVIEAIVWTGRKSR